MQVAHARSVGSCSTILPSRTAAVLALLAGLTVSTSIVRAQAVTSSTPAPRTAIAPMPADGFAPNVQIVVPNGRRMAHWRPAPVQLTQTNVQVTINEQASDTLVELTLFNGGSVPQEAQIVLPVPEGAAVRSFQYDGTGPEPTATILPRDEARRYYESIVSSMRDPGLLEFAGYGAIRSTVFPIPAGATQKVRIRYEQVLKASGERVDFVLPRSDSLSAGSSSFTASLSIRSSRGISTVFSPSHAMQAVRKGPNEYTITLDQASLNQPGSVLISYLTQPAAAGRASASVMAMPDPTLGEGKGYFMLVVGLPPEPAKENPMNREVTLVIDRSGSMRGEKIDQARKAALMVVEGLRPGESFNIVDYSDQVNSFATGAVIKDNASIAKARDYIRGLNAEGGTNLHGALLESLRPAPAKGTLPIVLFMTDGLPTVGERSEVKIREAAKAANGYSRRVFTFGVGYDVNSPLLSAVAQASKAAATFVLPNEDVEARVGQVFRRMEGPVLADASLKHNGTLRDMQPSIIGDVFDGDQVIILGRYDQTGPMKLRLEGSFGDAVKAYDFEVSTADASDRNGFVGRMWAQRRINSLLDSVRQAMADKPNLDPRTDPATKELVEEVVRLSTRFGVLTEYTAFLATEQDKKFAGDVRERTAQIMSEIASGRMTDRSGAGGVSQEVNMAPAASAASPGAASNVDTKRQAYYDASMRRREISNIQTVNDRAFVNRFGRWIDMTMLDQEALEPEQTVEVGTPAFNELASELVKGNLAGALSLEGDVYLKINGKRVLLKQNTNAQNPPQNQQPQQPDANQQPNP